MDISVTELKRRCLEIIRCVETLGWTVNITRRGKVVAQLEPSSLVLPDGNRPWERLRALGGKLAVHPGESSFQDEDFKALR